MDAIKKIYNYYYKIVDTNSNVLVNYTDEMKIAFARGICEGIEICNNEQTLKYNLDKM
jgi:hypothetical protein